MSITTKVEFNNATLLSFTPGEILVGVDTSIENVSSSP